LAGKVFFRSLGCVCPGLRGWNFFFHRSGSFDYAGSVPFELARVCFKFDPLFISCYGGLVLGVRNFFFFHFIFPHLHLVRGILLFGSQLIVGNCRGLPFDHSGFLPAFYFPAYDLFLFPTTPDPLSFGVSSSEFLFIHS